MEFRLLGPVEALANGRPVPLGGRQRRTVLAILLVDAGEAVSTGRLIDDLWADTPPGTARKTVQTHIAHLRKALNAQGEILTSANDGYKLRVDPESYDVTQFERMVDLGRSLRFEDPIASVQKLAEALKLFRGTPLTGVADDAFSLRVEASRLEEMRLAALEDYLDAQLATGEINAVITEANRLVMQHRLRERLWALLMIALYRAGRQGEALRTYSQVRRALAEDLGIEPSAELQNLEQRILDQDSALTDLGRVQVVSNPAAPHVRNPYKGLRAFDETDSEDFFGRDDLVRRLRERLEARGGSLVVLAGPSGAGKSSAVRAGLIPELRQQGHAVGVMFPGTDPSGVLAKTVAELTGDSPEDILERLQAGSSPTRDPLIIVVDQFEELFTMSHPDEAAKFLDLVTNSEGPLRLLVTVRADFLDRMLSHAHLGAVLEESLVLVPPLQDHEVTAASIGPAQRVGVGVEPELVRQILGDVRSRPAALPLLQYALTDTFERRAGETLTLADYQQAGGISGAVTRRAEEVYERLDEGQKEATRQFLLALVSVSEEGEEVRRRVNRDTLMSLPASTADLREVMERLGAQRLLTFDQDPATGQATVEVAHEALIAEWPRLTRWVRDSREDLQFRHRLTAAAQEWVDAGRDRGYLLSGSRLDLFSGWALDSGLDLTAHEQAYLELSLEARWAAAKQAGRTRRLIIGGVTGAVVVVTGLGVFALSQRQATDEQTRILRAADLAAAANDNLDIDPELSSLLAMEAVETTRRVDGTVLDAAEEALHRAVLSDRLLGRVSHSSEGIAHFSPDGQSFVTSSEDPTTPQVWSVEPFQLRLELSGHTDGVIDAVFDPTGDHIATTSWDSTVRLWDSASGQLDRTFQVDRAPPAIPVFSNDGSMLAATSWDGTTRIWNLDTGDTKELLPPDWTYATLNLEFSPDDTLLAVASLSDVDPRAEKSGPYIYDVATGELVKTLQGHLLPSVMDIGFTPDGTRIVTSGVDETVRVWDLESGVNTGTYHGHQGPVMDLQISTDGATVASSGWVDVLVWDLETFETKAVIVGHGGLIDGIDLSPGGDLLLTASNQDGTTRLWDLSAYWSRELVGLPGPAAEQVGLPGVDGGKTAGVAYSPDGSMLAATRGVDLITLWDTSTWRDIETFEGWNRRMEFDQGGGQIATAGFGGVNLHETGGGDRVADLVSGPQGNDVAFSARGMLASASSEGVRLWYSPTGGTGTLVSDTAGFSVAFDPDGRHLAMSLATDDSAVEIRRVDDGGLVATLEHTRPVFDVTFDSSGELLATAPDDTSAIIWDTTGYEPLHRLEGHTATVWSAAFDPIRPEIATASSDGTIKIWNVDTGGPRITLPAPGALTDVAYSPDGRYLAAISPEGFVTLYMLDVDELTAEAENRLTRWWTEVECRQYLQSEVCPLAPDGVAG
jgi:WD40 repeat protein/DNA-binding SARP family transcriptional activator